MVVFSISIALQTVSLIGTFDAQDLFIDVLQLREVHVIDFSFNLLIQTFILPMSTLP